MQAAVFGATGGIGGALVAQLAARADVARVVALARQPGPAAGKIMPLAFDLGDEAGIAAAAQTMGPLDLAIVASGALTLPDGTPPERSWRGIDPVAMAEAFRLNAIGPALVAKHVLPRFSRDARTVFAVISARVGSIADNRLGGWHSYRASKAALNMLVRNFAIELSRTHPLAICVALHPGTVATGLSAPFRRNVAPGQLVAPEVSARHLLEVIDGLDASDSGGFFGWDGRPIPF